MKKGFESDFAGFTFNENCKIHNIPLVKYSWGDQCPLCLSRDHLMWEGSNDPFIHKDCVTPAIPQNPNDFTFVMVSYAQALQPRERYHNKVKQIDEFAAIMTNATTLHKYDDVYQQLPKEGYLLLSKKSGKIVATLTTEKDPKDVKRSFI